jgi:cation diffusion facilitator family transporter
MKAKYIKIRRVLVIILALNLLVSILKIVTGLTSNSNSIFSDGLHSLSDGFNNVVGIIALSYAYKPADTNHPYGHKKFETMMSLFISVILLILAYQLFMRSVTSFNQVNSNIHISNLNIGIMLVTTIINVFVSKYEIRAGKQLDSSFLVSDAKHTLSDIYISISVIISLIGIKYFGLPKYFDNIIAIMVVIFIVRAAISIIKDAFNVLSDKKIIDATKIAEVACSFKEVKDVHTIKSRGFRDDPFIELHICVDPHMSIKDGHTLHHRIEKKIRENLLENADVNIHIEPYEKAKH